MTEPHTARPRRRRRRRRNAVLQTRSVARRRIQARAAGDRRRVRERRYFAESDRRLRVVQQRPQRRVAPRSGARHCRSAPREHAMGRRWRRRLRRDRQCRSRDRDRPGRMCRGISRARARSVRTLRSRHARPTHRRRVCAHDSVRFDVPRADVRDESAALHARARRRTICAARDFARELRARASESPRGDARAPARRGGLRRVALDRRTVSSIRLLPRERRRRGDGAGVGRTRRASSRTPLATCCPQSRAVTIARPRRYTTRRTTRRRRSRRWRRVCLQWRR